MIKGLGQSEASMRPKMTRLEVIANNLANITTTGFKRERMFVDVLNDSAEKAANGKGELDSVKVQEMTDFSEGSYVKTGNSLDLALQGNGFFSVRTPVGVRYTRNGNFTLATDGTIVTAEGYTVDGLNGPITVPNVQRYREGTLTVSEKGELSIDHDLIGTLRIVSFDDLQSLKKAGQSYFRADQGSRFVEGTGSETVVKQGYLEESNVNGLDEMVAMIELNRSFETDQKVIQAQDASIEKTLDVGRL